MVIGKDIHYCVIWPDLLFNFHCSSTHVISKYCSSLSNSRKGSTTENNNKFSNKKENFSFLGSMQTAVVSAVVAAAAAGELSVCPHWC